MSVKNLSALIEALLFVSPRPLSLKRLRELSGASAEAVKEAVSRLAEDYKKRESGIRLQQHGDNVQAVTASEVARQVKDFLKAEIASELTKPQLETLTILAYRGPLTKAEIEHIRGVNASLIVRNLLLRGLIEENGETAYGQKYRVTFEFLQHLGLTKQDELPQFEELSKDPVIDALLTVK